MQIDHSPFEAFSPKSRLWIFQSLTPLHADQQAVFRTELETFTSQWKAHQAPLTSAFSFYLDHFLVVAVDAAGHGTTGCSIDALHQKIEQVAQSMQLDLFDRLHIPVVVGGTIRLMTRKQLRTEWDGGQLNEDSLMLDHTVLDLLSWKDHWVKPIGESWVIRNAPQRLV